MSYSKGERNISSNFHLTQSVFLGVVDFWALGRAFGYLQTFGVGGLSGADAGQRGGGAWLLRAVPTSSSNMLQKKARSVNVGADSRSFSPSIPPGSAQQTL